MLFTTRQVRAIGITAAAATTFASSSAGRRSCERLRRRVTWAPAPPVNASPRCACARSDGRWCRPSVPPASTSCASEGSGTQVCGHGVEIQIKNPHGNLSKQPTESKRETEWISRSEGCHTNLAGEAGAVVVRGALDHAADVEEGRLRLNPLVKVLRIGVPAAIAENNGGGKGGGVK